jgi:hypothetical protein
VEGAVTKSDVVTFRFTKLAVPQRLHTMADGVAAWEPLIGEAIMLKYQGVLTLLGAVLLWLSSSGIAVAQADAKKSGKISGLLIEKNADSILVRTDKEEEPVKYTIDEKNKKQAAALKTVNTGSRVQLTFKTDGDSRQLVMIKRAVLAGSGTVRGTVVKVHGDSWVEVKLKSGNYEGFAPNARSLKDKAFMDRLKALQPGDSVVIQFATDAERRRIVAFKKN